MSSLARRIEPKHRWDDLVLPSAQLEQLAAICSQAKHSSIVYGAWRFDRKLSLGRGLNAMFTGQPGTGKTMAAEVIAAELGVEILKIDLSQIVSKYIGETEKNLRQLFDQAASANAILFFDEADALLGKRSDVKDAHDRYANTETAYLLQKMEEYPGHHDPGDKSQAEHGRGVHAPLALHRRLSRFPRTRIVCASGSPCGRLKCRSGRTSICRYWRDSFAWPAAAFATSRSRRRFSPRNRASRCRCAI